MERVVVYLGNANCYSMMRASAKSLLSHSEVDRIYFLTDDMRFPCQLPDIIHQVYIGGQNFFPPSCPNINPFYSYVTLMRTVLSKILPDEHKVLLLDPDTIVTAPVDPIWDYDVTDYYFAAVQETRNHNHEKNPYYNAGVMLMNLDKFRADGMDVRLIYELNHTQFPHIEQDALNFLCDGKILPLPSDYSVSFVTDETEHPVIYHCLSFDKKLFSKYAKPYAKLHWTDIMERQAKLHE